MPKYQKILFHFANIDTRRNNNWKKDKMEKNLIEFGAVNRKQLNRINIKHYQLQFNDSIHKDNGYPISNRYVQRPLSSEIKYFEK